MESISDKFFRLGNRSKINEQAAPNSYYLNLLESVITDLSEATVDDPISQQGEVMGDLLRRRHRQSQANFDKTRRSGLEGHDADVDLRAARRARLAHIANVAARRGRTGRSERLGKAMEEHPNYSVPQVNTDPRHANNPNKDAYLRSILDKQREIHRGAEGVVTGEFGRKREVAARRLAGRRGIAQDAYHPSYNSAPLQTNPHTGKMGTFSHWPEPKVPPVSDRPDRYGRRPKDF